MTISLPLPPDRKAAIAVGSVRFFTGEPCKHGHVATRRASSGECVECNLVATRKHKPTEHGALKIKERVKAQRQTGEWQLLTKNRNLKTQYGIGLATYNQLHEQQGGVCAICAKPEFIIDHQTNKPRALAVDHCHTTNRVRGLLCQACNTALGKFNDDIALLEKAVMYIKNQGELNCQ